MAKFSIIISQRGNASHKEECNNIKKIMDNEDCKNSWTRRNEKIHGQGGMQKFPSHHT
jgi:hypothetical protein